MFLEDDVNWCQDFTAYQHWESHAVDSLLSSLNVAVNKTRVFTWAT